MTGGELAQVITAIASLVAAIGSSVALVFGVVNRKGIQEVKQATDGMKDELVKVTGEKNFALGVKHEKDHPS